MSQLILEVTNEKIMDKLLWMLKHFESDGVMIKRYKDELIDSVVEHYEEKRANQVASTIDPKIVESYAKKHNLSTNEEAFWAKLG